MSSSWLEQTIRLTNICAIDAKSDAEQSHLIKQEVLLNKAMGGPLAEQAEEALDSIHAVLDLGCGPGGWVHTVAQTYPQMQATGIDISTTMIAYAQAMGRAMHLSNAHFHVMDATKPLDFPDASFDLVNARLISGFLLPEQWPLLMEECKRLLRPGGILRLTEGEWGIITGTAPATARLFRLGMDALHRAGRNFSPDGRYYAITPMLRQFLWQAGFHDLHFHAIVIDHSAGTPAHRSFCEDYQFLFKLGQPFILQQHLATQEELDTLYEQAVGEMLAANFGALMYLLTIWGKKE